MLIDTHCHLSFKAFNDSWPNVVMRAREKDVKIITVGSSKDTSEKAIAIAKKSDGVFAALGLHPTHAEDEPFDYEWFSSMADNPKVVAIGETGIDYYHIDDTPRHPEPVEGSHNKPRDPSTPPSTRFARSGFAQGDDEMRVVILQKQEDLLRQHLVLAREKNLPVILHGRDLPTPRLRAAGGQTETPPPTPSSKRRGFIAYEHLYKIISDFGYTRCVLHCFGGDWAVAQKFLDLGCLISFTGIVSFKNAGDSLKEVVRNIPLDKFMIETDAPYLAPEPYRGKQNEPAFVEYVARAIAEIRSAAYDDIAQATTENAIRFFGL